MANDKRERSGVTAKPRPLDGGDSFWLEDNPLGSLAAFDPLRETTAQSRALRKGEPFIPYEQRQHIPALPAAPRSQTPERPAPLLSRCPGYLWNCWRVPTADPESVVYGPQDPPRRPHVSTRGADLAFPASPNGRGCQNRGDQRHPQQPGRRVCHPVPILPPVQRSAALHGGQKDCPLRWLQAGSSAAGALRCLCGRQPCFR